MSRADLLAKDDKELLAIVANIAQKSHAANGYQKLSGGLIVQWGTGTTGASGAYATVAFAIAFPNNCFSLAVQAPNATATADVIETSSITASGFAAAGASSGSGGLTGVQFRYIAIGN